jgi:preprotein translocase subunit SecA
MITSIIDKLIGTKSARFLKKHEKILQQINDLEVEISKLTGEEIREKISNIREEINKKSNGSQHLPMVFAIVREAAKRTIGHRHYNVQILGGIALYQGYIAEMNTGEGKTLVATLVTTLRALEGPVHVVTVNEYLAERDCKLMGKIYNYLGLSCGYITNKNSQEEEIAVFSKKDIVYVSNHQIVFHYLRHLLRPSNHLGEIQRKFPQFSAVVDEIDNILIDEARTPFVISTPADENAAVLYGLINNIIKNLENELHYTVVFKSHNVFLTDEGTVFLEKALEDLNVITGSLYDSSNNHILHIIRNLLKAHHIFRKDIEYAIINDVIVIIDENTGRLSEGKRFGKGLHQALEAKESLEIKDESATLLSVTYTAFFKEYEHLCGMTGTASTEKEEFWETYRLEIIKIPTHRTRIRLDHDIRLYEKRETQLKGLMDLIKEKHSNSQPILVVTTNVQESETICYLLNRQDIKHQLLNAKNHKREAEFIANAGNLNSITVATNMAGRGTDIKLGGNIDFQIEQMLLMSNEANENLDEVVNEEKMAEEEHLGDIKFEEMNLTHSQKKKIKAILEAYEPIRDKVKSINGLCVITFGLPESEKILLQAIGRAGRQGDPGESYALYSLDDDVLKTSLQGSWNKFIFSQIFADGEEYVSGGPVLGTVRKLWGMINAKHFRSRKDLNKYENVRNQQRKDFFNYREVVLSADNKLTKELLKKCFEVFLREDYNLYSHDEMYRKFHINFTSKEELTKLFMDRVENNDIEYERVRSDMLEILDDIWKQHINEIESIQYGSGLAAYAQKDPFHEFSVQSSNTFKNSISKYRLELFSKFFASDAADEMDELLMNNSPSDMEEQLRKIMNLVSKLKNEEESKIDE